MNSLDQLIANAQRNITYLYWLLFAGSLVALLTLPKPLDDATKTLLLMMLGALITLITQQSSFWFARQRTSGIPDPTTTVTTTTKPDPTTGETHATTTVTPTPVVRPAAP